MTHPRLDAQDVSTILIPVAMNPDRRECWVSATGDNLNLREETIEDVHSARRGKDSDKDDTVLSYAVVEQDADGHDS